jgi:hypothetical protein
LGVTIDKNLNWSEDITTISKKISSSIGALKRVRPFISTRSAIQIYEALIQPKFDYCSAVYDELSDKLNDQLQKLQNRAARAITRSNYDIRSSELLKQLNWDTLAIRRKKQKAILMFKTMQNRTPVYLKNLFSNYTSEYSLRNKQYKLTVPKPRTEYQKRAFSYSGAILWNDLPPHVREIRSLQKFKTEIKSLY